MSENYYVCREENGTINISEEVLAALVKSSVTEVEGVAALANTASAEIAGLIGIKNVAKGVQISISGEEITADVIITVSYGSNIVDVAKKVQAAVNDALLAGAGAEKITVNVHVSGIAFHQK